MEIADEISKFSHPIIREVTTYSWSPSPRYGINKVQFEMLKIRFERRKKCETIIKKLVVSTERDYPKLSTRVVLVRVGWVI